MESNSHPLPARYSAPALVLVAAGCGTAFASLWTTWAIGDVDYGPVPHESGWHWMLYGDWLLTITCAVVLSVAAAITLRPQRHAVGLGIGAVLLIICAILGTLVIASLTATTLTDFDTVDYRAGNGPVISIGGLLVAAAGILVALFGAAPHRRPARLRWHLPHLGRHHPHTHGM